MIKTIPKETVETMFAQDFTPGSGNVETDNQLVDYIQSTVRTTDETDIDQESRNVEAERASVMGDVQLRESSTTTTGYRTRKCSSSSKHYFQMIQQELQ